MTAHKPSAADRVLKFIESGQTGTVREIAKAAAVGLETTYACLKRLQFESIAARVGERRVHGAPGRPVADVWGRKPEPAASETLNVVQAALQSRTPIEIAWNEGLET